MSINSQIIVDLVLFQEYNLNYIKPSINKLRKHINSDIYVFNFTKLFNNLIEKKLNKVKSNGKEPTELKNDNLLICSPIILGFSLNDKF